MDKLPEEIYDFLYNYVETGKIGEFEAIVKKIVNGYISKDKAIEAIEKELVKDWEVPCIKANINQALYRAAERVRQLSESI